MSSALRLIPADDALSPFDADAFMRDFKRGLFTEIAEAARACPAMAHQKAIDLWRTGTLDIDGLGHAHAMIRAIEAGEPDGLATDARLRIDAALRACDDPVVRGILMEAGNA